METKRSEALELKNRFAALEEETGGTGDGENGRQRERAKKLGKTKKYIKQIFNNENYFPKPGFVLGDSMRDRVMFANAVIGGKKLKPGP